MKKNHWHFIQVEPFTEESTYNKDSTDVATLDNYSGELHQFNTKYVEDNSVDHLPFRDPLHKR